MNRRNLLSTKHRLNLRWLVTKMIWLERGCRHATFYYNFTTSKAFVFFILTDFAYMVFYRLRMSITEQEIKNL